MGFIHLAYVLDWGWIRIGSPYIYINIDPVIVHLGPLALRWYGLMYVVGIVIGLWAIKGYTDRKGIDQDLIYRVLWWCIGAGVLGGRLYFVLQQPDLVQGYLMHPLRIIATWEGGMAFYGAIFLVLATLFWRARVERINPLVLIDAGVLFGAVGQIFGRIGNIINGDIVGYRSDNLPWSTVYQHPNSWACLPNSNICNVPVQPAAAYELLTNLVVLALMLYLARRVTRPGILMLVYLYCYTITQFFLFFTRDNAIMPFLGLQLKQAQWTSLLVFLVVIPLTYWVLRNSKPVPAGEVAATYGIPQKAKDVSIANITEAEHDQQQARAEKNEQEPSDESDAVEPAADQQIMIIKENEAPAAEAKAEEAVEEKSR
ncbi:MAG: prolipoprotein diacylglyceryl transferase [Chloroflexi bacterium]|nr:MAG: prolipoprotein diacylglyceryl transferase [Chloroflexota bacterium]